jgi:hypothetical protein
MRLSLLTVADFAQVTQDGKLSILGGNVHSIYAATFPAVQPFLAVAVLVDWEDADPGSVPLRIRFRNPDQTLLGDFRQVISKASGPFKVAPLSVMFTNLTFQTVGTFTIVADREDTGAILGQIALDLLHFGVLKGNGEE